MYSQLDPSTSGNAACQEVASAKIGVISQYLVPKDASYFRKELVIWLVLIAAGLILASSAPGIGLWFLSWVGLSPFFVAAYTSRDPAEAFIRGLLFGTAYNLVYLSWTLNLTPVLWPDEIRQYSGIANLLVCLLFSAQQGILFGTLSAILTVLPAKAAIGIGKGIPALLLVPVLWILIFNKLGTATGSMSVPWSMIEYSQYKQTALLQSACLIGGPGIAALIVMVNLALAFLYLKTRKHETACKRLKIDGFSGLIANLAFAALLSLGLIYFGENRLQSEDHKSNASTAVFSILQGNVLFKLNESDSGKHLNTYLALAAKAPPGVCVWPEWSLILPVSKFPAAFHAMAEMASRNGQNWILGCLDSDDKGKNYNAICSVGPSQLKGNLSVYRKQFLVPFGEYVPLWIQKSPFATLFGTFTPCGQGYSAAESKGVLACGSLSICPLLCCELMKPELSAKGVRAGAQVLTDCSNTLWFNSALLGEQSIAICSMRSAETHRSFIFASSTGPSAIIDPLGRVRKTAAKASCALLTDRIQIQSDVTPFVRWYQ